MPLSLWRRGETAQLRYLREFDHTQYMSEEELRDLQWSRLQAILSHAQERCPYYRRAFARAGVRPGDLRSPEDVRALPVLEKRDIQREGADMIAEGWPQGDLIRNQTGGSTGTPITFYLSRDRKCSRAAATLRHNAWAGWRVGDKAAVIWGAPRDRPGSNWRARIYGALLREPLWLDTAALTEASMAHFHEALWRYRPRVVHCRAASPYLASWPACRPRQPGSSPGMAKSGIDGGPNRSPASVPRSSVFATVFDLPPGLHSRRFRGNRRTTGMPSTRLWGRISARWLRSLTCSTRCLITC